MFWGPAASATSCENAFRHYAHLCCVRARKIDFNCFDSNDMTEIGAQAILIYLFSRNWMIFETLCEIAPIIIIILFGNFSVPHVWNERITRTWSWLCAAHSAYYTSQHLSAKNNNKVFFGGIASWSERCKHHVCIHRNHSYQQTAWAMWRRIHENALMSDIYALTKCEMQNDNQLFIFRLCFILVPKKLWSGHCANSYFSHFRSDAVDWIIQCTFFQSWYASVAWKSKIRGLSPRVELGIELWM